VLDTTITVVGNLVEDPRYATTQEGLARTRFRIASTPRRRDRASGEWVDADPLFLSVVAWRTLAAHCHDSLRKGDRVVVRGRLRRREWVNKDGLPRMDFEIDADACGPDLARSTVLVNRMHRDRGRSTEPVAAAEAAGMPEPVLAGAAVPGDPAWAVPGVAADAA
jgi:single-strand DNA-binding protein